MIEQISEFWRSQTSRLMLVYLSIIMVMSISYSVVIYFTSANQLERQLPSDSVISESQLAPMSQVSEYLRMLISESKQEMVVRLYVLNLIMLIFGTAFSFMLARWTLDPIERNVEAQTRFVSDASHELRTPLTAIQTSNEVALRKKKLTLKEARTVIEQNLADVDRLQRLTTTMLELLADDRPLDLQPTSIHDIVSRSMTDVAPMAVERKIKIEDKTENKQVMADISSATQALTILLDNAVKYSPPKKKVELTTSRLRRGTWAINVIDEGPGIEKEEQKKIFTRFYRSDAARSRNGSGGYGLGLEIAQMIARRHGGSIELKSTVGKGSTFSLVLPAARSKTTAVRVVSRLSM